VYGRPNIPTLDIVRVAWQHSSTSDRAAPLSKNGHAIPTFLTVPDHAVTCISDCLFRKFFLRRLEFLQASHVRLRFRQPPQQNRQAAIDPVDVVRGDLHIGLASQPASGLGFRASISEPRDITEVGNVETSEGRGGAIPHGYSTWANQTPLRRFRLIDRNLIPSAIAFCATAPRVRRSFVAA